MSTTRVRFVVLLVSAGLFSSDVGCGNSPTAPSDTESCSGYPDPTASAYVLPYAVGSTYGVSQGNCSRPGNGHRADNRYAYDFDMPIGRMVSAMRAGVAVHVETSHLDGQVAATGLDNYIVVRHNDGSYALYGHLTHDGAAIASGESIAQGQLIGQSGNTGNTNNIPHLHADIHLCDPVSGGTAACPTVPFTFRNAQPNPVRLRLNERYMALAY